LNAQLNSFVVADPKKCIGCRACEIACAVAHYDKEIKTVGCLDRPLISRLYLVKTAEVTMPVQCHHCENAPCVKSCTAKCIEYQDNKILIDEERCIGCKSCILACPFGAIELIISPCEIEKKNLLSMNTGGKENSSQAVVASKCDLCTRRSQGPACVEVCSQQALRYVDFYTERKRRQSEAAQAIGAFVESFRGQEG